MNIAFIRRIKSRFCPHKEIKTSEIFFLWSDSHFIVTACIKQWVIVIFSNNIMNKFKFKFFWAVESNCSGDCMSVVSFFNNDKKNIRRISDQHPENWFHWILTLFWSQICFYNPWLNQFWAFSQTNGWGQIPWVIWWKRNNPCSNPCHPLLPLGCWPSVIGFFSPNGFRVPMLSSLWILLLED